MPVSKRNRIVHLTQTESRGRARKSELIDKVQEYCQEFKSIYVFSCENMRTKPLKQLRSDMHESRFVYGKTNVIRFALGKTPEEAYMPGLDKLSEALKGDVGLIFTNVKPSAIEKQLEKVSEKDFARSGFCATQDVKVLKGPIEGQPSSMFEPLRKLFLPVHLNKGVIELEEDHYVCKKGDILTPEQAQALKFFGHKLADFSIKLQYRFRDGILTKLIEDDTMEEGEDEEEEDF